MIYEILYVISSFSGLGVVSGDSVKVWVKLLSSELDSRELEDSSVILLTDAS